LRYVATKRTDRAAVSKHTGLFQHTGGISRAKSGLGMSTLGMPMRMAIKNAAITATRTWRGVHPDNAISTRELGGLGPDWRTPDWRTPDRPRDESLCMCINLA